MAITRRPRTTGDDAVDLDWRTIAAGAATLAALLVLVAGFGNLPRTVTAIAIATVLALGIDPVVVRVGARLRVGRPIAIAVVLACLAAALGVVGFLVVPPALHQAQDFGAQLPHVIDDLEHLPLVGDRLAKAGIGDSIDRFVRELPARLTGRGTPVVRVGRSVAGGAVTATITLLLALSLLLDGDRLVRSVRRFVPEPHRAEADRLGELVYRVVGKYAAGSLLVAGIAGVTMLIAGLVLGVPLAPLAAVWVAVWDLVPQIGGAAGGIPFVLLGFTHGAVTGVICAVVFIVYLQVENNLISPLVVGRVVKLSPPATMTAALIGVASGGVVGALLAVPMLGAAKAIYVELRPPSRPDLRTREQ